MLTDETSTTDFAAMTSEQMIIATLDLFCGDGITEIRCLGAGGYGKQTDSGYFDDYTKAAKLCQQYVKDNRTRGVYFVINEVQPELLARAANRFEARATITTSDSGITSRRWLYVDCDPVRPSGISSTNEQVQQSLKRAADITEWMREKGLCEPISAFSGNGSHLLSPVCLPNDQETTSLISDVLVTLHEKFSDNAVSIDTSVSNAARICRLYGTIARKGDSTPDRPHRMARLLHVPDYLQRRTGEVCNVDALRAVAAMKDGDQKGSGRNSANRGSADRNSQRRFLLTEYLRDNDITFTESGGDPAKYTVSECLFNSDHKAPDAYFFQYAGGAHGYHCSHDSCAHNKWDQVKERFPPKPDHYDPPLRKKKDKQRAKAIRDARRSESKEHTPEAAVIAASIPRQYDETDRNDIGNAEHFAAKHRSSLRYCASWSKWLCWDGARWKLDEDDAVMRHAKEVVREIFDDALNAADDQILEWGVSSANISRMRAMVALAASELPILVSDMNQDSWMLNCQNGTVDLRTGELKPHRRSQCITKLCPTEYFADAESPIWLQFLQDVFVAPELIEFIRRLFGYFLTGDVSEQKLPIFWGSGSNGKSTLLNAFMRTIGDDYAMQAPNDFLMEKIGDSHPTEKASLFGKRFVSCVETEKTRKLAESLVKSLTGGEKIMARRMREDFWQFDPTHKIVLATNHRPIIKGSDHGIWRRLLLIPFEQQFEGARKDRTLPDRLQAEAPGILAWAVRGCLEWQRAGLNPPASVLAATDEYKSQEDIIGRFVAECCDEYPHGNTRFAQIYARFETWAEDSGDFLPPKRAVGAWLKEHGYEEFSANGRCYRGIKIRD
jgi:P4 family phage/plasmid primase-like protien